MKREHEHHSEMMDDRMVESTRQRGIERVIQKKGEMGRVGQPGKMTGKPSEKAHWKRSDSAMTPRKA